MADRLANAQRDFARLVRAQEGVSAALAADGDVTGESLDRWLRGDARAGARDRLSVYANAYFHRLLDILAAEFSALAAATEADGFHDLAALYVLSQPSSDPSVRWVGARLAEFLDAHPAAAPLRRRWPWAADLARLEWSLSEAFDAADASLLLRSDLESIAPEQWGDLVLRLHPSARVLRLSWPVHALQRASLGTDPADRVARAIPGTAAAESVLVWRRDELPHSRVLTPSEADLLSGVAGGETFGQLCERAAVAVGSERAAATAAEFLGVWLESALLVRDPAGGSSAGR